MEGVLINPQRLSLADFELVALVGRGSFGQVPPPPPPVLTGHVSSLLPY